jgi:hypothetical protein
MLWTALHRHMSAMNGACCEGTCDSEEPQASALAYGLASAPTHKGRCHRARQQDGPNGMGNDDQGRAIQGTRRARGVNEIASGSDVV